MLEQFIEICENILGGYIQGNGAENRVRLKLNYIIDTFLNRGNV